MTNYQKKYIKYKKKYLEAKKMYRGGDTSSYIFNQYIEDGYLITDAMDHKDMAEQANKSNQEILNANQEGYEKGLTTQGKKDAQIDAIEERYKKLKAELENIGKNENLRENSEVARLMGDHEGKLSAFLNSQKENLEDGIYPGTYKYEEKLTEQKEKVLAEKKKQEQEQQQAREEKEKQENQQAPQEQTQGKGILGWGILGLG